MKWSLASSLAAVWTRTSAGAMFQVKLLSQASEVLLDLLLLGQFAIPDVNLDAPTACFEHLGASVRVLGY